jgi:uncharacterized protein (DUF1697 family)
MTKYVSLLRAVNVGGTGKLSMTELKAMCDSSGFVNARTYIASGNVVFESNLTESAVKARLEKCLASYSGKPVEVMVRSGPEMAAILAKNPFKSRAPNATVAIFLDERPPTDTLKTITGQAGEEVALGTREIYVHYGAGMGRSKLKIPAAKKGTARNMNTVAKLADWANG